MFLWNVLAFLDKSQWKLVLFTSTMSGLELMFQSQKYLPFLKNLSSFHLPIA